MIRRQAPAPETQPRGDGRRCQWSCCRNQYDVCATDGVCLCHKTRDELRSMAADRGEVRLTLEERARILKTFIEEGGDR